MLEPSVFHVRIEYPENWEQLSARARDEATAEISIGLGAYLAYTACVWHEILTWFGYKGAGFYPEYMSAFSWEDCYSNAIGCRIGAAALGDSDQEFNQAVTRLLNDELTKLEVQAKPAAWVAGKKVYRTWFTGNYFWYRLVKRNFDIGLGDGLVTPWLVPGLPGCGEPRPQDGPIPTLDFLQPRGFSVRLEIEPKEWERNRILSIIYGRGPKGRIEPARHFGPILEYIRAQAIQRYGPGASDPDPASPSAPDLSALAARWLGNETS
jgi:hypothetical protein